MAGVWPLVGRGEELSVISDVLAGTGEYRGVAVAGPAGVGKSRLAREAVAAAATVRWVVGTATARAVPLGAFAQWTDGLDGNPLALVRQVIGAITAGAGDAPLLVAVDDAHLLDDLSAFVLHQLVLRGAALVVATIRSGETAPDAVSALWKDGHLRRLELQALSRAETEQLLLAVLGVPVDPAVTQRMWELSRGNALFVRQLVDQELASGRLTDDSGCWRWNGPVQVSASLIELVELQMGAVPEAVLEVVDVVAVGEPLDRAALATVVAGDPFEEAERRGLITVSGATGAETVRVGHPLYGEVRLAQCGTLRLRRLRGRLATALSRLGAGALVDPVRLGLLWLDSDLAPNPEVYLRAAEAAFLRIDLENAEQLARAAVAAGADIQARLLHAHALVLLNRGEEAAVILDAFTAADLSEQSWSQVVHSRAANLMWPLGRPAESWAVIDDALAGTSTGHAADLLAFRAVQLAFTARPADVPPLIDTLDLEAVEPLSALVAVWAQVIALGDLGRPQQAASAAAQGYALATRAPATAYQGVRLAEFHVNALILGGEIRAAEDAANRTYQQCVDVPGMPHSMATAVAGMAAVGGGDLIAAQRQLASAVSDFAKVNGRAGAWYRFSIVLVEVLARSGRVGEATAALATMRAGRHPSFVRVDSEAVLAQAWVSAASGRTAQARHIASRAAEFARDHGQWAIEVVCLQAAVTFGDKSVVARLDELVLLVEGPRAPLAARYARALSSGDGSAMATVSEDFETMGDRLAAAEAAAHAAAIFAGTGLRGSALTAGTRARRLAAQCGAVLHPGLQTAGSPLPLSRREHEIATLVAQGLTNKAIAEALTMSIRTVEGHIYRACARLGLSNRAELRTLIGEHTTLATAVT
jgi:DNA-binding CsgD family transcriptional regulator